MAIIAILGSYLLGSISFSVLIAKWLRGIDIRHHGSGNAGATNTLRILGKGPAIGVLLLDALKGITAVLIGHLVSDASWVAVACGIAAIIGHNWPVFFRFRGGKGIATTIGVLAMLAFVPALIAGMIAIAMIIWKRYVSLGSLIFTGLTPVFILLFRMDTSIFIGSLLLCAFAFYRHRTNIIKLVKGTENRLGSSKGGLPRVR
ncbi:glycerol-3-phosphate 1-O-acyltransferase PlsY [Paenibacillus sp. UMB4589-SE434]|uniref:glycerol-3-phosphate 1-O-acyltransferase PlsY n=1 Tax=Paenibacillus sp. UMB4589-SE434 TaxID=3046314 RepID=UPI00254C07CC|nr:glycerol-3-phosphate 1-O-acyltransferase PlsY [Paenibacillus sp. UMB4589-SE434]MDK8179461.1 glycerol-3-phosphate 1-O-acyltransferase PlsY [Paenibacillus sp. UMB4589-SE434]